MAMKLHPEEYIETMKKKLSFVPLWLAKFFFSIAAYIIFELKRVFLSHTEGDGVRVRIPQAEQAS